VFYDSPKGTLRGQKGHGEKNLSEPEHSHTVLGLGMVPAKRLRKGARGPNGAVHDNQDISPEKKKKKKKKLKGVIEGVLMLKTR